MKEDPPATAAGTDKRVILLRRFTGPWLVFTGSWLAFTAWLAVTGSWLAVGRGRHPHAAEFPLLFRRQLVLQANPEAEMEAFDLTFSIQHFVELG